MYLKIACKKDTFLPLFAFMRYIFCALYPGDCADFTKNIDIINPYIIQSSAIAIWFCLKASFPSKITYAVMYKIGIDIKNISIKNAFILLIGLAEVTFVLDT